MNLQGAAVRHSGFGDGTILDHTGNYLVIAFAQGKKEFLYPNAFSKHIQAVDPEIAAFINAEVAQYEASEDAIQKNKQLERIAADNLRREAMLKAAAAKKPAKKRAAKVVKEAPAVQKD